MDSFITIDVTPTPAVIAKDLITLPATEFSAYTEFIENRVRTIMLVFIFFFIFITAF